jgi:hypothetical protein
MKYSQNNLPLKPTVNRQSRVTAQENKAILITKVLLL